MARALTALTIGPFDPLGRTGVVADARAFAALGLHATAAATTAGETALSPADVAGQVEAVLGFATVDAVKLTCPDDAAVLDAIATLLVRYGAQHFVLDPADAVFNPECLDVLSRLLPLAEVAVPNTEEATALAGIQLESWEDMREAARVIAAMGPANVVIKGGKHPGALVTDLLFDGADYRDYTAERVGLAGVPGAGTTFAAAITATLAKRETVQHSVAAAKAYVTKALQQTYELGGEQALHLFYRYWQPSAPGL